MSESHTRDATPRASLVATMKCVGCAHQWTLRDPDLAPDDHPMCPHCLMPGILLKAERRLVNG